MPAEEENRTAKDAETLLTWRRDPEINLVLIDADGDKSYTRYPDESPYYSGCYLRGGGVTDRIANSWGTTVQYQDGSDDAEVSARPDKDEVVRPNLKARDELTVRTPRGPRTGLKSAREAGQRPAARSNAKASASASSGGAD